MSSLTTPGLRTGAVWEETWLALGAGSCALLGVGRADKTVNSLRDRHHRGMRLLPVISPMRRSPYKGWRSPLGVHMLRSVLEQVPRSRKENANGQMLGAGHPYVKLHARGGGPAVKQEKRLRCIGAGFILCMWLAVIAVCLHSR